MTLISHLEALGATACVLTETKLTPASPLWYTSRYAPWSLHRLDFSPEEAASPARRGGVALLVRSDVVSVSPLPGASLRGPLMWASWALDSAAWPYTVVFSAVYRSPSPRGGAPAQASQWAEASRLTGHVLSAPPPSAKPVLPLFMGDLNAHMGSATEGLYTAHLPPATATRSPTMPRPSPRSWPPIAPS